MTPPINALEINPNNSINDGPSRITAIAAPNSNSAANHGATAAEKALHTALHTSIFAGQTGPSPGSTLMAEGTLWVRNAGEHIRHLEATQRNLVERNILLLGSREGHQNSHDDMANAALQGGEVVDDLRAMNNDHERLRGVFSRDIARIQAKVKKLDMEKDVLKERLVTLMKINGHAEANVTADLGLAQKDRKLIQLLINQVISLEAEVVDLTAKNKEIADVNVAHYIEWLQKHRALNAKSTMAQNGFNPKTYAFADPATIGNREVEMEMGMEISTIEKVVTKSALEILDAQVTDLKTSLGEKDWVIDELMADKICLQENIAELQSSAGELERQHDLVNSLKTAKEGAEAAAAEKTVHIEKLLAEVKALANAGSLLEDKYQVMSSANNDKTAALEKEIATVWREKRQLQDTIKTLRDRVDNFETEFQAVAPSALVTYIAEIKRLNAHVSELSGQNATLQTHFDNMKTCLTNERSLVSMQERAHQAQMAKYKTKYQSPSPRTTSSSSKATPSHSRDSLPRTPRGHEENRQLEEQIADLATEKENLERECERLTLSLDTQRQQIDNYLREKAEQSAEEARVAADMVRLRLKIAVLDWEKQEVERMLFARINGLEYASAYDPFKSGVPALNTTGPL